MQIAYIFCYALASLSYLCWSSNRKEKKPASGDHELNLKLCWSNVVQIKCHNAILLTLKLSENKYFLT